MAGEAEVAALEESRRAALAEGDIEALSDLIADDYIHVHATALIHDKARCSIMYGNHRAPS
jgi:hypothetical protein